MLHRLRSLFFTKGQLASPPPALLEALGAWRSTASGVAISPELALRCPAVSCAVRAISEATARLPLSIYRVGTDDSREEATDHPAHALLTGTWNDWTSCFDGLYAGTVDALTNDSGALIFVNRANGAPRDFFASSPAHGASTVIWRRTNQVSAQPIAFCRSPTASMSARSARRIAHRSRLRGKRLD